MRDMSLVSQKAGAVGGASCASPITSVFFCQFAKGLSVETGASRGWGLQFDRGVLDSCVQMIGSDLLPEAPAIGTEHGKTFLKFFSTGPKWTQSARQRGNKLSPNTALRTKRVLHEGE